MTESSKLREMSNIVLNLRKEMDKLKKLGGDYKFVEMNIVRMSAMVKMLELGINDVVDILDA